MGRNTLYVAGSILIFVAGFVLGNVRDATSTVNAQGGKVFELRTYTSVDGLLPNLEARFRDHTMQIFERHGMENVGYWVPPGFARVGQHPHLHHLARQPSGLRRIAGRRSATTRSGRRCRRRLESTVRALSPVSRRCSWSRRITHRSSSVGDHGPGLRGDAEESR